MLSLVTPLYSGSQESYWRAPPSVSSAEFVIVLNDISDVHGVVLLVSPCGYSMSDAPTVSILTQANLTVNTLRKTVRFSISFRNLTYFSTEFLSLISVLLSVDSFCIHM